MILDVNCPVDRYRKRIERLALIKERYKKLVLEPRREIECEIEKILEEDSEFD